MSVRKPSQPRGSVSANAIRQKLNDLRRIRRAPVFYDRLCLNVVKCEHVGVFRFVGCYSVLDIFHGMCLLPFSAPTIARAAGNINIQI